jgi:hypothetical protein
MSQPAKLLLHRLPYLVPWGASINVVHLVEVDMICLQPLQAVLASPANVVGREAAVVRAAAHWLVHFGSQDDPVAPPTLGQPPADNLLRDAVALLHVWSLGPAVDVRGVEEVDASLQRPVHDLKGGSLVRQLTEVHGSQSKPTDLQASAAKICVLHFIHSISSIRLE